MTGAKGEYRGLAYRNDSELQAWLAKRPREPAQGPAALWHRPVRERFDDSFGCRPRSRFCERGLVPGPIGIRSRLPNPETARAALAVGDKHNASLRRSNQRMLTGAVDDQLCVGVLQQR